MVDVGSLHHSLLCIPDGNDKAGAWALRNFTAPLCFGFASVGKAQDTQIPTISSGIRQHLQQNMVSLHWWRSVKNMRISSCHDQPKGVSNVGHRSPGYPISWLKHVSPNEFCCCAMLSNWTRAYFSDGAPKQLWGAHCRCFWSAFSDQSGYMGQNWVPTLK